MSPLAHTQHFILTQLTRQEDAAREICHSTVRLEGDEAKKVRRNQTLLMEGMSQIPEELRRFCADFM